MAKSKHDSYIRRLGAQLAGLHGAGLHGSYIRRLGAQLAGLHRAGRICMIAITGATGRIGRRLCAKLAKKEKVVAIVRSEDSAKKLPKGTRFAIASLEYGDNLKEALSFAEYAVNLAGSTDTSLGEGELALANMTATGHFFNSLPDNVNRVVHVSSIAIYGKKPTRLPCDEFSHPNPDNAYARTKWAGELIARQGAARFPVTVLRPGIVYGPSFEEGFFPMLGKIKNGGAKIIGDGENRIPLVHVDDVVSAILLSLKSKKEGLSVYNICGEEATQRRILSMAAKELGASAPKEKISYPMAKALARANEIISSISGNRTSFTSDMVDQMALDRVFDTSLAKKELGWSARIGLKVGIAQTAKEYKAFSKRENERRSEAISGKEKGNKAERRNEAISGKGKVNKALSKREKHGQDS